MTFVPDLTPPDPAVADSTFRMLLRLFGTMRRVMDPFFAQHGISGAQWGILTTLDRLARQGQPCPRLSDLSHHMLIRPPTITNAIERLIRAGLIQRAECDGDHRVKRVGLSVAGKKLVGQVTAGHSALTASVFSVLSAQQQGQLREMLASLTEHVQSLDQSPGRRATAGQNHT